MRRSLLPMAICGLILLAFQRMSAYNLRHISSKDGLTNSSVLSLAQKPDGTMLFGTVDGLYRYDGTQVWSYMLNLGQYIRGNLIEDVLCTKDHNIWVLTNYGLNVITDRGRHVEFYSQFQGLRTIRMNSEGHAFLLGENALYYQNTDGKFKTIPLPGINPEDVRDYALTEKYLYVFHQKGILQYAMSSGKNGYTVGRKTRIDNVSIVTANGSNNAEYLVDDNGGLFRFDLKTGYKRQLASLADEIAQRGKVSDIVEFRGSLLVSFFNHGVVKLDLQKNNALPADIGIDTGVFRMIKDQYQDIVWIGTDGKGIYMCCDEPFALRTFTYGEKNIGLSCPLRAILRDDAGTLWIGTKGDGLLAIPHFEFSTTNFNSPKTYFNESNSGLSSNVIYALLGRGSQGIWISGAKGVDYFSQATNTIVPVKTDVPLREVVAAQEYDGKLWMATLGFGVYCADIVFEGAQPRLTNIKNYVLEKGKLSSNYFFCLTRDNRGNWWFGNRGKGLFMFEKGKLKHIEPDKKYTNPCINDVFSLLPVGDGLWVGTGCGIIISDKNGRSNLVDAGQGLPGNTIHALVRGGKNEVWATTNAGVVALSSNGNILRVYGRKNGLDVTEYCDGAALLHKNELYFGGINGLAVIRQYTPVKHAERSTQLAFTTLLVNGVQQNINEFLSADSDTRTLTLSYQQNSFRLGVASLDYLSEPFIRYYYRLSNGDEWYDNGQDNIFSFLHLSPGKHTLYIKYRNMATGLESDTFKLYVVITPPWYRSGWAWLCYSLLFVGLAYRLFIRWRARQKEKQAAELERMNQIQRDELYEEKLNFLTNVVHELNTPLTLIYGPCERILAHEAGNEFVHKYVRQIIRNLTRLNSLIQEIIDFRKVTTGHHVVNIKRIDVSTLIKEDAEAFREMAERCHVNYECQIVDGIIWNSDEKALARIVANLISNAFKYTKSGGTVQVKLVQEGEQLVFSVYNTGAGISKANQEHIFDYYSVFNNVEESLTGEQTTRNGLGMAICHKMVKMLGGNIQIESEVGHYARFVVTLPLSALPQNSLTVPEPDSNDDVQLQQTSFVDDQDAGVVKKNVSKPKRLTGETAPTILLIDDHQDILDLLSESLEGYHLLSAHNGDEGFELLKTEQPDLIITDLMMPGMDGLDFIQQVKQNKYTMHIPLIILSAKSSDEERIEGLESGADVYISKPFSIGYLQATVGRLLESRIELKEYYNSPASAYAYAAGKLMSKADQDFVDQVIKQIEANMRDVNLNPEVLAKLLHISLRHLYRKFELVSLPPPKEYIRMYKVNTAARMLATTDMTIQEIVFATGFTTRSRFYGEFRKQYGMTPKDYREQCKCNEDPFA